MIGTHLDCLVTDTKVGISLSPQAVTVAWDWSEITTKVRRLVDWLLKSVVMCACNHQTLIGPCIQSTKVWYMICFHLIEGNDLDCLVTETKVSISLSPQAILVAWDWSEITMKVQRLVDWLLKGGVMCACVALMTLDSLWYFWCVQVLETVFSKPVRQSILFKMSLVFRWIFWENLCFPDMTNSLDWKHTMFIP